MTTLGLLGDAINWLKSSGDQYNGLTPGEVVAMTLDLEQLKQEGAEFTP